MSHLAIMPTAVSAAYPQPVIYPVSDGQPMGESDLHVDETLALKAVLGEHFKAERRVYVASNNFFYFEEDNPRAVFSPDLYVVRGVEKRQRRTYKLWEEERVPCFILEVSSRDTWKRDYQDKLQLYAQLGVEDYFLYDPAGETNQPPLVGYRLSQPAEAASSAEVQPEGQGAGVQRARYQRIRAEADGGLLSQALGLKLWLDQARKLRFTVPESGRLLLRPQQAYAAVERAARELELAETRARVQAARAEAEAARAKAEAARAKAEAARAKAEAARADAAEQELERLRRLLSR